MEYARIADESTQDTPRGFSAPEFHVDGVPFRSVAVGVDSDGRQLYETIAIEIPHDVPSLYWREGC
jgi:hypothetical protein